MKPMLAWSAVIALLVSLAVAGGCSLDSLPVDVPRPVQQELGVPSKTTLGEAPYLLEEYQRKYQAKQDALAAEYQSGLNQFVAEIEDSQFVANIFTQAVDDGLPMINAAVGNVGIPGGAILTGLVGALAGYLTRRTPKAVLDAEYDAGREEALDTLSKGKNP